MCECKLFQLKANNPPGCPAGKTSAKKGERVPRPSDQQDRSDNWLRTCQPLQKSWNRAALHANTLHRPRAGLRSSASPSLPRAPAPAE